MTTYGKVGEHTKFSVKTDLEDGSMEILITRGPFTCTVKVPPEDQPFDVKQEWEIRHE